MKPLTSVLIEAMVVGLGLVMLLFAVQRAIGSNVGFWGIFITGAVFHLLCEWSGVNVWYAKNYCSILP